MIMAAEMPGADTDNANDPTVQSSDPVNGPPPGVDPLRFAWSWFGKLKRNQDDLRERVAFLEDQTGIRLAAEGGAASAETAEASPRESTG